MDGLSEEQRALFASIMGNSSQAGARSPIIPSQNEQPVSASADANRILSQAEIDALIASMAG